MFHVKTVKYLINIARHRNVMDTAKEDELVEGEMIGIEKDEKKGED
ncbi:MAG: hypothetical protein U9R19_16620 [Bacteroidota bacterium]|nr:hypothetical protein [Bacteroidota bacterium]